MKRRSFLQAILGAPAIPLMVKHALPEQIETPVVLDSGIEALANSIDMTAVYGITCSVVSSEFLGFPLRHE